MAKATTDDSYELAVARFLKEFRKVAGNFKIRKDGMIRCTKNDCPLVGIYHASIPRKEWLNQITNVNAEAAAEQCGITHCQVVEDIIAAADNSIRELINGTAGDDADRLRRRIRLRIGMVALLLDAGYKLSNNTEEQV